MRSSDQLLIAAAVAICLLALVSGGQSYAETEQTTPGGNQSEHKSFKLPKLFDFAYFKERFGKKYATLGEELARKTYFVARAFRAFVSGMNFKWRRSSYYLAVNHMSDASPQELEARTNKKLAKSHHQQQAGTRVAAHNDLPEFMPAEGEDYEQEIQKLLEKHRDEPGYSELLQVESHSRKKRSVDNDVETLGPRDFSLDDLIKPGVHEVVPESPEVEAKIANDVESNNPDYRPPEILTEGLNDDHAELQEWRIEPKVRRDRRPIHEQLDNSLGAIAGRMLSSLPMFQGINENNNNKKQDHKRWREDDEEEEEDDEQEEDEVEVEDNVIYFDHRDSHCLSKPRDQGDCGACYAFASTALMEWLYCTKKGKLVPFSEQYMIDCGNKRFDPEGDLMAGCDGSTDYEVFKFLNNFGVERQKSYPYTQREHHCPYDDGTDLKAAGYIKMELGDFTAVPVSRWAEYIEYGPLYFSIASPTDYSEYSGGVHDGQNCKDLAEHAQLLVGHGREDGQDYWLIRNSYGTKWGDGGYFKLSKDAPHRCIENQLGFALGTKDARHYKVRPKKNHENLVLRKEKKSKKSKNGKKVKEVKKIPGQSKGIRLQ